MRFVSSRHDNPRRVHAQIGQAKSEKCDQQLASIALQKRERIAELATQHRGLIAC